MALLEDHRNTIYNFFAPHLGKEATQAMLSQFPARDVEEGVTKEHLDRRLAEQDRRIAEQMQALSEKLEAKLDDKLDRLNNRMFTLAGLGLVAIGIMLQAFT